MTPVSRNILVLPLTLPLERIRYVHTAAEAAVLSAAHCCSRCPDCSAVSHQTRKVTVFAAYTFVLEGAPLWFTVFVDAFFTPFIILFIIWMFFNVALRSRHPELWAGMGRAIERPFHVLGALAGEMLLEQKVSHGVMSLVYMGLLILTVVLLYRLFLLYAEVWKHSAVEESLAKVKAEAAAQTSANIFEKEIAAENNKDTTAVNHLAAVSADNFADRNPETVVDEA